MLLLREAPPLRKTIRAKAPGGRSYQWNPQSAEAANVPARLKFGSDEGGFKSMDCRLAREPGLDYADLGMFSDIKVEGAGGESLWEGRLEGAPRQSGDEIAVDPEAVGWQAHLDDDKRAVLLGVDGDLGRWGDVSRTRRVAELEAGWRRPGSWNIARDDAEPQIHFEMTRIAVSSTVASNNVHYTSPVPIGLLHYTTGQPTAGGHGSGWSRRAVLWEREGQAEESNVGTNHGGSAATVSATLEATGKPKRTVELRQAFNGTFTGDGQWGHTWVPTVYGRHGLPLHGSEPKGLLAHEVIAHILNTFCPLLRVDHSLTPVSFIQHQLAWLEGQTPRRMIEDCNRPHGFQLAVWEDRTAWWHPPHSRGREWRARVGPSNLQETGARADRLWDRITVSYRDPDGSTRTVGPPGSGADTEDETLQVTDPDHPAVRAGVPRHDKLVMDIVSRPGVAIEVGRRFLAESAQLDRSGKATLVGTVEDHRGIPHPAAEVRGGDTIAFMDASDPSPRRIVSADHDDESLTTSVDLDSPPEGLDALLSRLGVAIQPLGL